MAKFSSLRSGADGCMDGWMNGKEMDGIHQRLISRKKKYG
jgi:hypothetical protein